MFIVYHVSICLSPISLCYSASPSLSRPLYRILPLYPYSQRGTRPTLTHTRGLHKNILSGGYLLACLHACMPACPPPGCLRERTDAAPGTRCPGPISGAAEEPVSGIGILLQSGKTCLEHRNPSSAEKSFFGTGISLRHKNLMKLFGRRMFRCIGAQFQGPMR